jgi:hypothetical protein
VAISSPRLFFLYLFLYDEVLLNKLLSAPPPRVPPVGMGLLPDEWVAWIDDVLESPPRSGPGLWAAVAVAPQITAAWIASSPENFNTNYWVTWLFVTLMVRHGSSELHARVSALLSGQLPSLRRFLVDQVFKPWLVSICFVVLVGIASKVLFLVPWWCFDAVLLWPLWCGAMFSVLVRPLPQFWSRQWHSKLVGVTQYALLAVPLAFNDNVWWDLFVYLLLVLPLVVTVGLASRWAAGRATPSQLNFLLPFLKDFLAPIIKVKEDERLKSSVEAFDRLTQASRLGRHFAHLG